LGVAPQKVVVSVSIKFDVSVEPVLKEAASALKTQWSQQGQRFIIIAASTRQGEDEIILQAYKQCLEKIPELLLILVPRHPERFQQVATMISVANLSIQRRSQMAKGATQVDVDPCTQVLLGDSMGELMLLYGCADIAFVGGSLVATGGHNMLEPAAWGLPVMTGPSNFNFEEISALLQNAGALTQVADGEQLQQRWLSLAADKSSREQQGNNARQTIAANSGALERLLAEIDQLKQTP
jgi:3-deoxy-D-manno-octulosonic-acid transferase